MQERALSEEEQKVWDILSKPYTPPSMWVAMLSSPEEFRKQYLLEELTLEDSRELR